LWKRDRIDDALICLPPSETICKNFQQGLAKIGVDWFPSIEMSSLELIHTYVESGFGIGLSVSIPKAKLRESLRALPLPGFPAVAVGALWRGKTTPLLQALIDEMKRRAQSIST